MRCQLTELKKWIEEQKEVCQKGYIEASNEEFKSMYSSENAAFGIVIMKIDKLLSESLPVTGESEAIENFLQELQFQPYPEDIFPPISKEDLAKIHLLLKKEMKMPLDRLTGNIGRELRKPIIESAIRVSNLYKQSKK